MLAALHLLPLVLLLAACTQPPTNPAPPAAPPTDLRIMTFNIRYGTADDGDHAWPKRKDLVFRLVNEHPYDIVGLQEALRFQIDEIVESSKGRLAVFGVGRDDGKDAGEFSPILYHTGRLTLDPDPATRGTRWLSDTPDTPGSKSWGNDIPRIFTFAKFTIAQGGSVWVYNTHLDHRSEPARRRSAQAIARHIAEHAGAAPVILTGDFNCGESSNAIRYLKGEAARAADDPTPPPAPTPVESPKLVDTFRSTFPDEKNVGTFQGFGKSVGPDKIDYIFVRRGTQILDAAIDRRTFEGRFPSDHWAVTAQVRWAP